MFADRLRNILAHAQRALENPVKRRKLRRGSIVAAIAFGGVFALDYVLPGGPDWNPVGADAPRFELVSSAAAAERPYLPPSTAHAPAPELPERLVAEPILFTHDPSVSADDLLGAPIFVAEFNTDIELANLLETLKPQPSPSLELLLHPVALQPLWR